MSNPVVTVPKANSPFVKHRLGGWLPADPEHWRKWVKDTVEHVRKHHQKKLPELHPSIKKLWTLIDSNTEVRMLFSMMLEQVPLQPPYNQNPAGGQEFRSWQEMLLTFDYQLTQGPIWLYNTAGQQGLIGFPFNAFLDWPMGTPAGIFTFLRSDINQCLKDMLDEYGTFLKSAESANVLNMTPEGWFAPEAMSVMIHVAEPNPPPGIKFYDIYECTPTLPHFGFYSWDAFFIRKFRDGVRPVYMKDVDPRKDPYIRNCCESGPYALAGGVSLRDQFWLKGQPYSLGDMLGGVANAEIFAGGTVYQAFLSALSYHCWHAPVDGTVKKIINLPGSYYAENYWEGFANATGPDPAAPNDSQGYICQVATRSVMLLEAANPDIGLMGIVLVGMAEVSSCEWYVKEGDSVKKGQLIGTFHFGGSTHCLLFRPGISLDFIPAATPPYPETEANLPVCGLLATVKPLE